MEAQQPPHKHKEPKTVEKTNDPVTSQIGDHERFQLIIAFLLTLSRITPAYHLLGHIFLAAPTPKTCVETTNPNATNVCDGCEKWEYSTSIFETTIVMEWDLVCKRAPLSSLSQSIVMAGIMVGSILFGIIADIVGRRPTFLACCLMQLITGLIVCLSPYYWFYCLFRFLVTVATGGLMTTSFVLVMEIIGPKRRAIITILYHVPFMMGHASLALWAYFIREWRWLQFAISIISVIYIFYFCVIPESPRWLFTTGQVDEAIKVLEKIAKYNNVRTDTIRVEMETAHRISIERSSEKKGNLIKLFRTPFMRLKTFCMGFNWFVVTMVFYGLTQYIGKMGGDIFLNVFISALLSMPGTVVCLILTKFTGRKMTLIISSLISSAALFSLCIIQFFEHLSPFVGSVCAGVGLFGTSITFAIVYLYGSELMPTVVRSNGMGLFSMVGRLGSIIAPAICDLSNYGLWVTPLIFGVFPLIALIGTVYLPETKNQPLPETLEDGETFGRK